MNLKLLSTLLSLILIILSPSLLKGGEWSLRLASGIVTTGYNDVRIPPDTGTQFSLKDDLKTDASLYFRVQLGYRLAARHSLHLLIAPLSLKASGRVNRLILFNGEDFGPGSPLKALYRFNSYRLTYRYDFLSRKKFRAGIGFTAKIRDAEIRLEDGTKRTSNTNLGFVPLLHLRLEWMPQESLSLLLDADAAAASQGRAEDVFLGFQYHLNRSLSIGGGYRILEGGADVDSVYTFAALHFGEIFTTIRF